LNKSGSDVHVVNALRVLWAFLILDFESKSGIRCNPWVFE